MSTTTTDAVRRGVTVQAPPDRAFELFTAGIAEWWPLETHSPGAMKGAPPDTLVFEGRPGGRLYDKAGQTETDWGRVTAWEPPRRLVLAWKVNPSWPAETEIEVTFTADGEGTRVDLEHRGWERLGEVGPEARGSYNDGWIPVLERYEEAARP